MNAFKKTALALGLALSAVTSFASTVVIDHFSANTTPQTPFNGLWVNSTKLTDSQINTGANILGGYRKLQLDHTAGDGISQLSVTSHKLRFSNDADTSSVATARWDGTNTAAAGFALNQDWSELSALSLDVGTSDGNFIYELTLFSGSAANFSTLRGTGVATTGFTFLYNLSWFLAGVAEPGFMVSPLGPIYSIKGGTGVNLADVDAVQFTVKSFAAGDITVDEAGVIPEPASLALLGLGLVGAGFSSRKRVAK